VAGYFVLTSTDKWRDPWYRRLPPHTQRVWDYLTAPPIEPREGIIEGLIEDLSHEAMVSVEQFDDALAQLQRDGKIAREGDCILVINWFRHQVRPTSEYVNQKDKRFVRAWQGLMKRLHKCPKLVKIWLETHAPDRVSEIFPNGLDAASALEPIAWQGLGKGLASPTEAKEKIREDKIREDLSCPDSGESARRKGRERKPEDQKYIDLASTIADEIDSLIEQYNHAHGRLDNRSMKSATALRLLLTKDIPQMVPDEIIQVLRYSWATVEGSFSWGPQLLSIDGWRSNDKFKKAWSKWKNRKHDISTPAQRPGYELAPDGTVIFDG
jgi:hypothetical protein